MGPGNIAKLVQHDKESLEHLSFENISIYFGHSLILGMVLTYATYFVAKKIRGGDISQKKRNKLILGATNMLFLTVGITALMMLVSNNLARAFAIAACIRLIHFRVGIGRKALSTNILFAIIAGVACGVEMVAVAWIVTGLYIVIQLGMLALMSRTSGGKVDLDDDELDNSTA